MNRLTRLLPVLALGWWSAAQAATPYTLTLNGQPISGAVINQGGKLYFSAEVLKAAGLTVVVKGNTVTLTRQAAGGADPLTAVSGCLNQPLFNGIWRFKVLSVAGDADAWHLKVEVRNGAAQTGLSMIGTGLPFDKNFNLQLAGGAVLAANSGAPELRDRPFLQAEAFTATLDFDKNGAAGQPVKLVVPLDPAGTLNTGLSYSVKDPSFRVDLTCRK